MGWTLGHRPALDGLRGIAVLMVVFAHLFTTPVAFAWMGHAGVTIFFVLSGFLITSLLQDEFETTGRISLRAFYARRARRLGPALVTVVAAVLMVSIVWHRYANWPTVIGALTWTTNWITIGQSHVLALRYTDPRPLGHTWSLAIEEQFYLVWPILLMAMFWLGRRVALAMTVVGLAASAALPLTVVHNANHVQYGTDTRAASLLAGCALALLMRRRPEGDTVRATPALLLVLITLATWAHGATYRFENTVVSLLTAVLIWAVAQGDGGSFLDAAWLRFVGKRSYALYLWHVPIFWVAALTLSSAPWALAAVGVPAAWVAALLSWRFVESPVSRHWLASTSGPSRPLHLSTVSPAPREGYVASA